MTLKKNELQKVSGVVAVGSMSKKGCCWDNAVAESFFGSLKQERVHWRNYPTRFSAQQDILNYITMEPVTAIDFIRIWITKALMTLKDKTMNYKK
jgi:hypothetical protein